MGWQFTLAEFVGGPLMIILVALGFRLWMRGRIVKEAREQADRGVVGSMEGHAAMDMSVTAEGSVWSRLFSRDGITAVSHCYVMDWASVLRDIAIGLLVAGWLSLGTIRYYHQLELLAVPESGTTWRTSRRTSLLPPRPSRGRRREDRG